MKRVGARSSGFVCSPRANIARNFLAPAKLPEEKKKKAFLGELSCVFVSRGGRPGVPSGLVRLSLPRQVGSVAPGRVCWEDAAYAPSGQPEPFPSCLAIPRKKTRSVLTTSWGGFSSAFCVRKLVVVKQSSGRGAASPQAAGVVGKSSGVLTEELLRVDMPSANQLTSLTCTAYKKRAYFTGNRAADRNKHGVVGLRVVFSPPILAALSCQLKQQGLKSWLWLRPSRRLPLKTLFSLCMPEVALNAVKVEFLF